MTARDVLQLAYRNMEGGCFEEPVRPDFLRE
jgi:hypothetical protein